MIADLKPYAEYKESGLPWLGQVPGHWDTRVLKRLCSRSALYGANIPATNYVSSGVRFLRTTDITDDGTLRSGGVFVDQDAALDYMLDDGDLLISRSGTIGRSLRYRASVHGLCSYAGYLVRFVPGSVASPDYLFHFTKSLAFADFIRISAISSTIENVNGEKYANMPVTLPPPSEQAAIVRFMDWANGRLERAIRAKRKVIALLNQQKQAIIHRAVTRGLDPSVPLKPSGIPWLGDIPRHWEVVRSRRLFSPRKDLALPDDVQLSATQAYGVIPQADFEDKVGRRVVKISMHLEKRRHVDKDDFVISMRSFQGGLERAWASGAIRSSYVVLKSEGSVNIEFFAYLLKSRGYIGALQATADFIRDGQDLTFTNFRRVDLPFLPLEEQKSIAQFIAGATVGIDTTRFRLEREIELLREYRTRLVADVVTGKLDVREAAARLPDEAAPDTTEDDTDLSNEIEPGDDEAAL
jgi:type I restriction enzyme S subunit